MEATRIRGVDRRLRSGVEQGTDQHLTPARLANLSQIDPRKQELPRANMEPV
jgi:hypothetical protein